MFFANEGIRGDLFHHLNIDSVDDKNYLRATAVHYCQSDSYQAEYLFLDNHHFKLTYDVKGPQKDYCSETLFFRNEEDINIEKYTFR